MEKSDGKIKWVKQVGNFYISDQFLGRGEYSEVYLGCFKDYSKKVAVKIMKQELIASDPYVLETLDRQYDMLKPIDHENVVKFYEMVKTPKNWYFFFEFCGLGTLESYLKKKKGKITEAKALLILMDICEGYKALYNLNIIHRDLKPANVLMSETGVKISDFSFAKVLSHDEKNIQLIQSFVGTPVYSPLEILEGKAYSSKCDVWSVGVMFYQMLCGRLPFIWKAVENNTLTNGGIGRLAEEIRKNELDFPVGLKISKSLKQITEKMLQKQEKNRISWEDLFILVENLDFNDLCSIPFALQNFTTINQEEFMEKSGLTKRANMGKSMVCSAFHSKLRLSQYFNEEDLNDMDIDEKIGGVEVPEFQSSKSLNNI